MFGGIGNIEIDCGSRVVQFQIALKLKQKLIFSLTYLTIPF